MNFLITTQELSEKIVEDLPYKMEFMFLEPYNILFENDQLIDENENILGLTSGYVRDHNIDITDASLQKLSALEQIEENWPATKKISGSFSSAIINKNDLSISICTDLIGLYPLYHLIKDQKLYISNSLILLGIISGNELDEAGIAQRCLPPEYANLGSRTILKNCKSLLPAEHRKFQFPELKAQIRFDSSLYSDISEPKQDHQLHQKYWRDFKKEVAYCLSETSETNIALSGGVDSRIVLGAIPKDKNLRCLSFGSSENYEVKIASKLAKIRQAHFENFYAPELYFPPGELMKKYTLKTEGVKIPSWFELVENVSTKDTTQRAPLLLGELCEALPGRKIKRYNSKKFRQENFLKYYIKNEDFQFTKATSENFEAWKEQILHQYILWYKEQTLAQLKISKNREELIEILKSDLGEIFQRIEDHNLPYAELYDELFSWYTYTRMRLSRQLLICGTKFQAYSPAMSLKVLRNTSNIHPNLRLNYRFAKKLFNEFPELHELGTIPTGQAPLLPFNSPDFIKFPVWGLRSRVDSFLIKRLMKKKDPEMRYRLFRSINWMKVYQNPDMEKNLKDYFHNNHLGENFFEQIFKTCVHRKNLELWPFANIDIISVSALNMEIDLIKRNQLRH